MSTTTSEVILPYVAGARAAAGGGEIFPLVNPANGAVFAEVAASDEAQLDDAVAAAQAAQRTWWRIAPEKRGELLSRWGELVLREADALAELDTQSMGKPLRETRREAPSIANRIRYWSGMADKITGRQLPIAPGHLTYTVREPLGVVGVIVPWNGPMGMFVGRVSVALACGNAVVGKPSEITPLSAIRIAELTAEAGIPEGLVNVVTGDGKVGALLAAHPGVKGLQFTGSVETGRKVAALAAPTFKQVVLELGGKAPNVVFADADLDAVARGTAWGVFSNTGQACVATSRLLVERSVEKDVLDRITSLARALRVGDPYDPETQLGPLASQRQFERVCDYLELAKSDAHALVGGTAHGPGYYVDPTVLVDLDPQGRLAQEEIFGPVLSVIPFDTEDEALELANGVEFGLSANIWTRDVGRMLRFADGLEAGTIWGNTARLLHPGLPFGGFKDSGLGNASGEGALEGNTRLKRVSILYGNETAGPGF
ncbi:MAG TPA: aldehyde dehydrogenase family protein [Gaiellaceae bacterium]|jgi:acyl-CoA reductase-like NAD-dependent aldehyde dehydrogenase